MPFLSNLSDIRIGETGHIFEGHQFGDVNISFFFTDAKPGDGPAMHFHSYEEVFVILDCQATFTIDGETVEAGKGDILLAPAYAHHKFINSGVDQLSTINIHPSDRVIQEMVPE
jgi:mannose-6-phosphate isomerase-like protein (cupin superfamily)